MWVHPSPSSFFLFRYGIDVKKVPFVSWLGGQKLLLLCKCLIANVCLDSASLCYYCLCVLIPLLTVLTSLFEWAKTVHFFRMSSVLHPSLKAFRIPSSSFYSYVSNVVCHISKYLISFATNGQHHGARGKHSFVLLFPAYRTGNSQQALDRDNRWTSVLIND